MAGDFASTMRELSAAAVREKRPGGDVTPLLREFDALDARLQNIEALLTRHTESMPSIRTEHQKIEEHLAAIRGTESVNQRLFDSLHEELLKYRDNFLLESLHKPFVRDLIVLYDDLTTLAEQLRIAAAEKKRDRLARWRDNLNNAIHGLIEILHRLEVTEIESNDFVDLSIHKVVSFEPAEFAEDNGRIVTRVKRGFMWRGKVLRAEEVIAKRFH
ncbi:MAG: nucleotide exchange factor GrpE [Verrucomicrobia bacterium]|nr:nucleotide exchange factor GrpE [Verrucomicrobiota bacterium]